jgi:hypothetical protein
MIVDLYELTGVKAKETKNDTVPTVKYDGGRCNLEIYIKNSRFDYKESCMIALELIGMGFSITEVKTNRLNASKTMNVDEFADIYKQTQRISQ